MNKQTHKICSVGDLVEVFGWLRSHFETGAGHPLKLEYGKYREARTLNQNAALFGHAYKIISEHTGDDINDIHWRMCGEYFGWITFEYYGRTLKRPFRSTTHDELGMDDKISTSDFAKLFEFVQDKAAMDDGLVIPDPDPNFREKLAYQIEFEEDKKDEICKL